MLENGFISLHRSLLNWEWYDDVNTKILFIHLLLTVNYEQKVWHGVTIERGQRVCSVAILADELHLTIQQTRTAIIHLQSTNEITIKTTNKYSLVTVVKYNDYQEIKKQSTNKTTGKTETSQQTDNKQTTNEQQQRNKANKANNENKRAYAEFVTMTEEQYQKLIDAYGEKRTLACITKLDLYKGMHGKKYSSDYHAILKWVIGEVIKEEPPAPKFAILEG